jgi:hypothetical protein
MRKKSGGNIKPVQVDPITGEYYVSIPEWIMNEMSWYEDTEIQFNIEGNEVILSENTDA